MAKNTRLELRTNVEGLTLIDLPNPDPQKDLIIERKVDGEIFYEVFTVQFDNKNGNPTRYWHDVLTPGEYAHYLSVRVSKEDSKVKCLGKKSE